MVRRVERGTPIKAPAAPTKKSAGFKALAQRVTTVAQRVGFVAGKIPEFSDRAPRNSKRTEQAARAVLPVGRRK
jgi:hypothetical protein